MEKNKFSGHALDLMTHSSETNWSEICGDEFPSDADLYGRLRASAMD